DRAPLWTSIKSSPSRGPPRSVRLRSDQSNGVGRCSVSLPAAKLSIQTSPYTSVSVHVLKRCIVTISCWTLVLIALADLLGGGGPRRDFVVGAGGKCGLLLGHAIELASHEEEGDGYDQEYACQHGEIEHGLDVGIQAGQPAVDGEVSDGHGDEPAG